MPSMQATIVEERWTPTMIQTAFVLPTSELRKKKVSTVSSVSINLPFPTHLGAFALSVKRLGKVGRSAYCPVAFSFRRNDGAIPWGRTSIRAQLSLAVEQPQLESTDPEHDSHPSIDTKGELLGTIELVLADTPSVQVPITTWSNLSILTPNKVSLTVTISDCALPGGLFQARSIPVPINEGRAQAHLVRQSCDHHLLSQLLATGKSFDVKFLTPSTRSISGTTGDPLPTHASLSVVEEHVDISSSVLREGWMNALAPLDDDDGTKCVQEISCSDQYDHELDSDFEDEDEAPVCHSSSERDLAAREDQQSDGVTEKSSSSFSSFGLERASDQGSVDHQLEEIVNVIPLKEPLPDADYERTVEIKFAAHRTWRAFLWYCYTGNIEFSKLRSQVQPGGRHLLAPLEGGPPACSPKSMYRLALLVGNKDLKAKALAAIKERMTEENVLGEAFSVFTSKYPEVRQVQLDVLKEHRRSPEVKQAFLGAMKKFSSMPHANPVLSAFYDDLVA